MRFLSLILCWLMGLVILTGASGAAETESDAIHLKIVCLGDSITRAGYPSELANLLGVKVINAGIGGNTSRQGLARIEKDVLAHQPDMVLVFFGANDSRLDAPEKHVPLSEYKNNLRTIIQRSRQVGAQVMLGTPPPIDAEAYYTRHPKEFYEPKGGLDKWLARYTASVIEVGQEEGVLVLDLNRLLLKEQWRKPDGVHPTESGNQILAGLFAKQILSSFPALITNGTRQFVGIGARPLPGADILIDGSRETLDRKWTYWQGPRFGSSLPIKWKMVKDPATPGTVLMTFDPAAEGGKYGAADIVTKREYRDFRLHIEFLVMNEGGNSGVYLQNRYEIQICDGDKTRHGMGTVINETDSPYFAYNGLGNWNAYDLVFRAARFEEGKVAEKARVTLYFNGLKVHRDHRIDQVWGGPNSGIDGGNDGGKGITDSPGGLKLQCEGHDVRYRNAWIKELNLDETSSTDF